MLTFNEAIKEYGIPEKIYLGNAKKLTELHKEKRFRKIEKVYYPERYKDDKGELRYGRRLIKVSFKEKQKKEKPKKREV